MDNASIKKLEADLWESADLLRAGSKLTSNQYCMPVLGLLFLRYAYGRYKMVEEEILKDALVERYDKLKADYDEVCTLISDNDARNEQMGEIHHGAEGTGRSACRI